MTFGSPLNLLLFTERPVISIKNYIFVGPLLFLNIHLLFVVVYLGSLLICIIFNTVSIH